ncbi:DUF4262 domain-containing protein [uncultured Shewanella sp.]|uniref:DUF4262 domain-containing protein n=1 Tax=uncultured Shewanella sp. TaxID=173975 RepID=UPI002638A62A|nr:DUF4262 domain-containing protein [uncultured Shewanella sp.]
MEKWGSDTPEREEVDIATINQQTIEYIEQDGLCFGHPNDEHTVTFGMCAHGLPDLLISSRDLETNKIILSCIAKDWLKNGVNLQTRDDLIEYDSGKPFILKFNVIYNGEPMFSHTMDFYRTHPQYQKLYSPEVVQVLWQNYQGLFPNEPGYDKACYQYYFTPWVIDISH